MSVAWLRARISGQVVSGLAVAALLGWGSFGYVAVSSARQVGTLTAERDAVVAEHQRLQETAGQLAQADAKLASARTEYNRAAQGLAELRTKIGTAQQELATLGKRVDPGADRVSTTGSIRQPEPPKRPAR